MGDKRRLFDDLMEGLDAVRGEREGKLTLRRFKAKPLPPLEVTPAQIRATREQLAVSRPVFAQALRVSPRTLENWEQGRARPGPQAAALILMVGKYPDTLARLRNLDSRVA